MNIEPPEIEAVENKPFVVFVLVLIVLIGLAMWQFYSLAWGDVLRSSYTASPHDRSTATSLATTPE